MLREGALSMPIPVPAARLTLADRVLRLVISALAAAALGAGAAFARDFWRAPHGVIVSVFVLFPALCLWLVVSQRRVPWRRAWKWLHLELLTVFSVAPLAWTLIYGNSILDYRLGVMAIVGLIASSASAVALVIWQRFRPPLQGPYCPGCGYCLIGTGSDCCPECGRSFTLDELGVERDALDVESHEPAD